MPLRDFPKYDALRELARFAPSADPSAIETLMALLRVAGECLQALDSHFSAHSLSQGRFSVLTFLEQAGDSGLSATQLAEKSMVTRATMTGLIDALEREGLARRFPHPTDRRTNIIRITPKGSQILRSIMPDHFQAMGKIMEGLNVEQRETLRGLLTEVLAGVYLAAPHLKDTEFQDMAEGALPVHGFGHSSPVQSHRIHQRPSEDDGQDRP